MALSYRYYLLARVKWRRATGSRARRRHATTPPNPHALARAPRGNATLSSKIIWGIWIPRLFVQNIRAIRILKDHKKFQETRVKSAFPFDIC